ncbi:MAG: Holliday junction resolvase RuvX [Saprospiraceae bacterium]|nr:MAG: Holliday junction resolvase YqgF [Bacteroidetes bacterium OLB9]MCO6463585.1 Holliday junction resolvase RuvX [Saprospiraceae bacterium]MCZ2339628.1 Holliday junction resolvase RuvX [Chitinophagales bacterium]
MARIIGIDYGMKRCGLSVTDPLQIIVSGLETVNTNELMPFLENYIKNETVDLIVIGLPIHKDGNFTYLKVSIDQFVASFSKKFPAIKIDFTDEQFSSVLAKQIILDSGVKKKKRQDKALVDKVSAVVILQKYLKHI